MTTSWTTMTDWPPDLLRVVDLTHESLAELLDLSARMKADPLGWLDAFPAASLACFFEEPSTRSRASAEAAAHRLGMLPITLGPDEVRLTGGHRVADTARVLSRYAAAVFVRTADQDTLEELAAAASVPVINALSDDHHPCQALADLLTLRERFGALQGLTLAYIGPAGNIAHSLMEAGALAGMHVRLACPPGRGPDVEVRVAAEEIADLHDGSVALIEDPREAVKGADVVYTDAWTSGQARGYQVDVPLMDLAKGTALFMHSRPAHRGDEVHPRVFEGRRSVVWEQAENRLPTEEAAIFALATAAAAA
jgi:ornithine carbamoyltransferase